MNLHYPDHHSRILREVYIDAYYPGSLVLLGEVVRIVDGLLGNCEHLLAPEM